MIFKYTLLKVVLYKVLKTLPFYFLLFTINLFAQIDAVDAGVDITISAGLPVTLTGTYLGYTGLPITGQDDYFVGPFDIGFNFEYYGESHTQFAVSPNGLLSFYVPDIINLSHQEVTAIPNNIFIKTIMGPYQDLFSKPINPHSEYIYYLTIGSAPNRKLIAGWCDAPMYSCADELATYQIVLNESDNTIINHVISKPYCGYLGNYATHGLNFDDDLGIAVTGRNATPWVASSESWLFEPAGSNTYNISEIDFEPEVIVPQGKIDWTWYKDQYPGGEVAGTNRTLIAYPLETTTYYVEITLCGGMKYDDEVEVKVIPIPNAFNPNSSVEVNRTFKLFANSTEQINRFHMYIYNRWGQLMYETADINEGWDGTKNGNPCNIGVYVWAIYYESEKGEVTNKGTVTLVR